MKSSRKLWGEPLSSSLYLVLAIVGLSLIGIGAIWGAAHLWYHISIVARMAIAVVLLLLSQAGVAVVLFQNREGTLWAEGMAIVHCVTVFVSLAIAEQTFYIGWNTSSYVGICALLCLPAMYLLRSFGAVVIYALAVLTWAALDGAVYSGFGPLTLWGFIVLLVPFYQVMVRQHDEKRLAWYAWVMMVTIFLALGLASKDGAYIPFLLLSALASVVLLLGYALGPQKAWALPLRWIGSIAAIVALLFSCLPGSWDGIARLDSFPLSSAGLAVILCVAIVGILWRGVQKRLWTPVLYGAIPFIIGIETMVVRSGVYSSVPLIMSTVYILLLGFFEIGQGMQGQSAGGHLKFGIAILVAVVISFIIGNSAVALIPVVVIVILALVMVQIRRTKQSKRMAAVRSARRVKLQEQRHTVQAKMAAEIAKNHPMPPVEEDEGIPEWMKDIHIPAPERTEETAPATPVEAMPAQMNTVIPKEEPKSLFVAPVFHEPDDMPLARVPETKKVTPPTPTVAPKASGSPWQTPNPQGAKRQKHFSKSPWSQEGGKN